MKLLEDNFAKSIERISTDIESGVCRAVGSAFPKDIYTQAEIKKIFGIKNKVVNKLMDSGHIKQRHLYLPKVDESTGFIVDESVEDLHDKFLMGIRDIGVRAAQNAMDNAGVKAEQIDHLIAVTSSGFMVPGVSSVLARELGLKDSLHRSDIVGMGCNAGMSALYNGALGVKANKDLTTLIVCCEVNSASYVKDETIRTGIVNSLFGDGASAMVLQGADAFRNQTGQGGSEQIPLTFIDFETFTISQQWGAMRFDYNSEQNKWSFFLSKDIPFVIGENMKHPVNRLLQRSGIKKEEISHWVLHTGGGAVIDGAKKSVGLDEEQVRHTRSVLRDYGNLSSGSFIVSLERFQQEGSIKKGDLGMLIAMGPGSTIEAGLVRFF